MILAMFGFVSAIAEKVSMRCSRSVWVQEAGGEEFFERGFLVSARGIELWTGKQGGSGRLWK